MPEFRRGVAGMQQPSSAKNPYPAFCPEIRWANDREEKFLVFLNRAEDIPTVELHQFIPVGTGTSKAGKAYTRYEQFIARTDQAIGEDKDDLTDRLQHKANPRTLAVAVELEPTYAMVNGRKRPKGFEVKTETYNRKTEDGGSEEVEAPVIGVVVQSPYNFFGWLGSFSESTGPIEDTPLQVIRRGKDAKTTYDFMPFIDQEINYDNLIQLIENVGYLRGETDQLPDDQKEAALDIGTRMLERRLNELSDADRYKEMVTPIQEIEDRFGGGTPAPKAEAKVPTFEEMVPPANGGSNSDKFAELRKLHESS